MRRNVQLEKLCREVFGLCPLIGAAGLGEIHAAREENPQNYGPKPVLMNQEPLVWADGVKHQKTSMARKGT